LSSERSRDVGENHGTKCWLVSPFRNPKWFSVFLEAENLLHVCMMKDLGNCKLIMIDGYLGRTTMKPWSFIMEACVDSM
jgi:hypothetical protein